MSLAQIRQKLITFLEAYRKNSGTFKGFEVVFDYINFLKSEPFLKEYVADIFAYTEKQIEAIRAIAKNNNEQTEMMNNLIFDPHNPADMSGLPKTKLSLCKKIPKQVGIF